MNGSFRDGYPWYSVGKEMHRDFKDQNPTILVIFGITGDLSRRKLIPALFHLHRKHMLPKLLQIVGFSRRELTNEELHKEIGDIIGVPSKDDAATLVSFQKLFIYKRGQFGDAKGYAELAASLGRVDNEWRVCANKLFYLAVPPEYYTDILKHLDKSGLTEPCSPEEGWTRVIVEKPFGKDAETAEELDRLLGRLFREEQIYRIDHYLGKETVQNILAFRFSNSFLAPSWDRRSIERITIRMHERLTVERRGAFYDSVGALRDVGQNHLLQLLALFAMEQPENFSPEAIRAGRLAALRSLRPLTPKDVRTRTVRGQYEGYRNASSVDLRSTTETYFRITTFLKSQRWRGVPFVIEAGKALGKDFAEVEVVFKHREPCLCPASAPVTAGKPGDKEKHYTNVLRYVIQPNESITMSFWVKRPGTDMIVEEKDFSFDYKGAYDNELFIEAYEKLLLDTIMGNQTLFVSTDEIKASWKFIDPIVLAWQKNAVPLRMYKPGTAPDSVL